MGTSFHQELAEIGDVAAESEVTATGRVIFTEGGKGGVGKTAFMTMLVDWFEVHGLPCTLLDLDFENKASGSFAHYYPDRCRKVNIHTSEGLDSFVDSLTGDCPIVIADMGASSGAVAHKWFDVMHGSAAEMGIVFTAVGVITPDPASVQSVLAWGEALQDRCEYLIVKNAVTDPADFSYWTSTRQPREFRAAFSPAEIAMEYRVPKLENAARQHGLTLATVAGRGAIGVTELQTPAIVARANGHRKRMFAELDRVKDRLLL